MYKKNRTKPEAPQRYSWKYPTYEQAARVRRIRGEAKFKIRRRPNGTFDLMKGVEVNG